MSVRLSLVFYKKILEETQKDIEALYSAVKSDNYEEVQSLLSKKVNVNSIDNNGKTPLHFAAIEGNVEIVKALIKTGAGVNIADKSGRIPLFEAAFYGHKDATEVLLNNGAKVDTVMKSLLQSMMEYNYNSSHKDIVKALLNKGANADAVDSYGHTLLHWAAREGHTDIAELLLEKGANVNIQDKDLWTPLHFATKNKVFMYYAYRPANASAKTVKFLIEKGADVDVQNDKGETPLHLAAANGHKEVVEVLLKAEGINVNAVDENGKTPFDLTTNEEIKTLLKAAENPEEDAGTQQKEKQEGNAPSGSDITNQEADKTVNSGSGTPQTQQGTTSTEQGTAKHPAPVEPSTPTQNKGGQGTGVQDNAVAPTEPAQTEEQPSSFFGSLFSILMKPFSLIASFFGSFFSWLFGSNTDESTSQTDASVSLLRSNSLEEEDNSGYSVTDTNM